MSSKKYLVFIFILALASACTVVTTKQDLDKTQSQIRQFQTREYDTNDTKLIMKAVLNVLQDDGFIVKNAVIDLGLISATKEVDLNQSRASSGGFWGQFLADLANPKQNQSNKQVTYRKIQIVEASVNITEMGTRSRVRANFQAKILDNVGNVVEVKQVDDAKFFQEFFAKVDKGIFLQKHGL